MMYVVLIPMALNKKLKGFPGFSKTYSRTIEEKA
jgi:hypothetical protein